MVDTVNFELVQGADWVINIGLQNDDSTPVDLTGCQVHMQVRPYPSASAVVIDLSTANSGITITNAAQGQIAWHMTAAQTALLTPALSSPPGFQPSTLQRFLGYFDLFVEFTDGEILPYLNGQMFLDISITHPF